MPQTHTTFLGPTGPNTEVLRVGNRGSGLVFEIRVALGDSLQEPEQQT